MKQALISLVFVFAFAAVGFGAVDDKGAEKPDATLSERLAYYQIYKQCADSALQRQLDRDEVLRCTAVYIELKLSFVDGVTLANYPYLDASTRARVNREGYLAFRDWVDDRIINLN